MNVNFGCLTFDSIKIILKKLEITQFINSTTPNTDFSDSFCFDNSDSNPKGKSTNFFYGSKTYTFCFICFNPHVFRYLRDLFDHSIIIYRYTPPDVELDDLGFNESHVPRWLSNNEFTSEDSSILDLTAFTKRWVEYKKKASLLIDEKEGEKEKEKEKGDDFEERNRYLVEYTKIIYRSILATKKHVTEIRLKIPVFTTTIAEWEKLRALLTEDMERDNALEELQNQLIEIMVKLHCGYDISSAILKFMERDLKIMKASSNKLLFRQSSPKKKVKREKTKKIQSPLVSATTTMESAKFIQFDGFIMEPTPPKEVKEKISIREEDETPSKELRLNSLTDLVSEFLRIAVGEAGMEMADIFLEVPVIKMAYSDPYEENWLINVEYSKCVIPALWTAFRDAERWVIGFSGNKIKLQNLAHLDRIFIVAGKLCGHSLKANLACNYKRNQGKASMQILNKQREHLCKELKLLIYVRLGLPLTSFRLR